MGPLIVLSRHMEDVCDGRNNLRILGSMFEAWIGALYLQEEAVGFGLQQCNDFIVNIIEKIRSDEDLLVESVTQWLKDNPGKTINGVPSGQKRNP